MGAGVWVGGLLLGALACEVAGNAVLAASRQFTGIAPFLAFVRLYAVVLVLLTFSLTSLPLAPLCVLFGLICGTLTMVGFLLWRPVLDRAAVSGLALIGTGVMAIQLLPLAAID